MITVCIDWLCVYVQFVAVEDHVTKLLDKIPEFSSACKKFAKGSQDINAK